MMMIMMMTITIPPARFTRDIGTAQSYGRQKAGNGDIALVVFAVLYSASFCRRDSIITTQNTAHQMPLGHFLFPGTAGVHAPDPVVPHPGTPIGRAGRAYRDKNC